MADFELTIADDGKTLTIRPNDRVVVRLPEGAAGGGHLWQLDRIDDHIIALESKRYEPPPEPPPGTRPRAGADRTVILTFVAKRPGQATIALKAARPWDPRAVAKRFLVEIDVTD